MFCFDGCHGGGHQRQQRDCLPPSRPTSPPSPLPCHGSSCAAAAATARRRLRGLCAHLDMSQPVLPVLRAPAALAKVVTRFKASQITPASKFFLQNGYCVIDAALSVDDLRFLNALCDNSLRAHPELWGADKASNNADFMYFQPLLDHSELDAFARHPSSFPLVSAVLGGTPRFSEFDFRETSAGAGDLRMPMHHDQGSNGASSAERIRARMQYPQSSSRSTDNRSRGCYHHCEHVCLIHYLTDVDMATPAFAVIPGSHRIPAVDPPERGVPQEVITVLGSEFQELPIYGPAGSAILYDISLYHTRRDGPGRRRTQHSYFARAGTPALTE
jgi:hypothetical protein